jgi:hypothetical protein
MNWFPPVPFLSSLPRLSVAVKAPPDNSGGTGLLGGADLIVLLVLAFAGALVVGNILALVRPPTRLAAGDGSGPPPRPALGRSLAMIGVGSVAVIWAVATLTS